MSTSDAQKRASTKYLKSLSSISIRVKPEFADQVRQRAQKKGLSMRAYLLDLIQQDMQDGK